MSRLWTRSRKSFNPFTTGSTSKADRKTTTVERSRRLLPRAAIEFCTIVTSFSCLLQTVSDIANEILYHSSPSSKKLVADRSSCGTAWNVRSPLRPKPGFDAVEIFAPSVEALSIWIQLGGLLDAGGREAWRRSERARGGSNIDCNWPTPTRQKRERSKSIRSYDYRRRRWSRRHGDHRFDARPKRRNVVNPETALEISRRSTRRRR